MVIEMRCPACGVEGMTKIYERTNRSGVVKAFWFCKGVVEGFEHVVYTEGKDGELFYKTVDRWSILYPLLTLSKETDEEKRCKSMIQLGTKKYLTRCQRTNGHDGNHLTNVKLYQLESEEKTKIMSESERFEYYTRTINRIEKLIKEESKKVTELSNELSYFMLKMQEDLPNRNNRQLDSALTHMSDTQSDNTQQVSSHLTGLENAYHNLSSDSRNSPWVFTN